MTTQRGPRTQLRILDPSPPEAQSDDDLVTGDRPRQPRLFHSRSPLRLSSSNVLLSTHQSRDVRAATTGRKGIRARSGSCLDKAAGIFLNNSMPDPVDPIPPVDASSRDRSTTPASTGLPSNVAAALACIPLIGGIIFYVLEKRDAFVRFYAMQSIIFGGAWIIFSIIWNILFAVLAHIPVLGWFFALDPLDHLGDLE